MRATTRPALPDANSRFQCTECTFVFEQPGNMTVSRVMLYTGESIDELNTGVELSLSKAGWTAQCPRCGREAIAINQVTLEQGGHWATGFADTPEQVEALRASVFADLKTLPKDASLDEVASLLEQTPQLRPLARYLRAHAHELAALSIGIDLVAVVLTLVAWLMPMNDEVAPPAPPDGITYEQMQELVDELREEAQPANNPGREPDEQSQSRNADTLPDAAE